MFTNMVNNNNMAVPTFRTQDLVHKIVNARSSTFDAVEFIRGLQVSVINIFGMIWSDSPPHSTDEKEEETENFLQSTT